MSPTTEAEAVYEAVETISEEKALEAVCDILQNIPNYKNYCQSDVRTQRDQLAKLLNEYIDGMKPRDLLRELMELFEHSKIVRWWRAELLFR